MIVQIVKSIKEHGIPIYAEKEFHLKPTRVKEDCCYYGDILAVYNKGARHFLIGIEIKNWKEKVNRQIAKEYLAVYGEVCEYFYLAARRFSKQIFGIPSIGLFSLERMEIIKGAKYLSPDEQLRISAIERMKEGGLRKNVIDSQKQTSMDEFLNFDSSC